MLSKAVLDGLNEQIRNEFYSGYLYLSMAAFCEGKDLPGAAHWLRLQQAEEFSHAMKLFEYVVDRHEQPTMLAIEQPPADFASLLDVFDKTLEHERRVTESINQLYALTMRENDYATQVMLQEFVKEQVEEEKNAQQILAQVRAVGASSSAIFFIDRHLGKRE